jgi:hypothetical protein
MGTVEVDETYIGGEETGLRGGRAKGKPRTTERHLAIVSGALNQLR